MIFIALFCHGTSLKNSLGLFYVFFSYFLKFKFKCVSLYSTYLKKSNVNLVKIFGKTLPNGYPKNSFYSFLIYVFLSGE